jgi:hypothetical protein
LTRTSGRKDNDGDRRRTHRPRSASCRWSEREHAEQRADRKEDRAAALGNGKGVGLGLQVVGLGDFIPPGGVLGAVPSQPWRRGSLDALPYVDESDRRRVGEIDGPWIGRKARPEGRILMG